MTSLAPASLDPNHEIAGDSPTLLERLLETVAAPTPEKEEDLTRWRERLTQALRQTEQTLALLDESYKYSLALHAYNQKARECTEVYHTNRLKLLQIRTRLQ